MPNSFQANWQPISAGRYVEFVIYPFSYAEFSELYRTVFPDAQRRRLFFQYLLSGGMPYLSNLRYEEEPCRQYLTDLFNSVQLKDIVQRGKVRDVDLLQRILAYVMANVGDDLFRHLFKPVFKERTAERLS